MLLFVSKNEKMEGEKGKENEDWINVKSPKKTKFDDLDFPFWKICKEVLYLRKIINFY